MNINYITKVEGNEALLDKYVDAVFAGTCKPAKIYPFPYQLSGEENCLDSPLIEYFFQQTPFRLERAVEFVEKLRKIDKQGFNGIHYPLDKWVEANIQKPFFYNENEANKRTIVVALKLRPEADPTTASPDHLKFMCYLAVCHLKYGPSYASVTANQYFQMATDLGSDEVARLKKFGSGELPKEVTEYKDDQISCVANDAFATIKVTLKKEDAASYQQIFWFINRLLQTSFPRSYSIEFTAKQKTWLPIKGLPKKGIHALFANAVAYESVHPLLVEYAGIAMKTHEWYTNINAEECAMPSTFAVFALGLTSDAYFGLVKQYMKTVDEEHQEIQVKFTPAFVEKFGITEQSLPVFMSCLLSTQEHKHHKLFAEQFESAEKLTMLLNFKANFAQYLIDELENEDGEEVANYLWESVLFAIFGPQDKYPKLLSNASETLRPLYAALFEEIEEPEDLA
ncbi:DUF6138 family protein [Hymenobacter norwichensis]|uniref:DUF6138 family protein n=1 Tax=Hymenobacter norwichensis TaxID=223903 RepID=UPI0003B6A570|nr:DUF6138 family protein [Hymenobacter norwichensis]